MEAVPRLLITGWKDIGEAFGVTAETAQNWAEKYKMPVVVFNRTPTLNPSTFNMWYAELVQRGKVFAPCDNTPP